MASVRVSEEQVARLAEFQQVVNAILDEQLTFEQCIELVLEQGLRCMLADIIGVQRKAVLLESLQQLSQQHPAEIYAFVADALRRGAVVVERERLRWRIGIFPGRPEEGSIR